jgi:hypothetical protein
MFTFVAVCTLLFVLQGFYTQFRVSSAVGRFDDMYTMWVSPESVGARAREDLSEGACGFHQCCTRPLAFISRRDGECANPLLFALSLCTVALARRGYQYLHPVLVFPAPFADSSTCLVQAAMFSHRRLAMVSL